MILALKAKRFQQIADLEGQLAICVAQIDGAKAHLKQLRTRQEDLIASMRAAARNEGALPLFEFDDISDEELTTTFDKGD
jgi:hypothetical protein